MAEKIRVGVVGTSWYSDYLHLAKLKEHPGADHGAVRVSAAATAASTARALLAASVYS